jgi:nucleoside-diphosphate-sugar epimerase
MAREDLGVKQCTGGDDQLRHQHPGFPKQRQPDISLAQKVLDWKPCVPLKEGLVQTVADFERLLFGQGIERAASRRDLMKRIAH